MVVRRSISLVIMAALALFASPVASVAAVKFATIDMARVLREYDEVQRVAARLQAQKDEYQEQIDKQQQEIRQLNEKIQNTKDAEQKSKLDKQKKSKLVSLQNKFQQLKEKLGEMEKEQFDLIKEQIYREIDKMASSRGVEMILEKQWLYHPRQAEDLTEELLRSLESGKGSGGFKKGGGKPAPTPKPEDQE